MFSSDIRELQTKINTNDQPNSQCSYKAANSDLDLQYELYHRYMQFSKEQITIQQLIAIKDSQNLIQSIALNNKIDLNKDISSTMDSFSYDDDFENSISQDFSTIQKRSARKITRKGTRQSVLNPMGRTTEQFQQILEELQRNCSEKTYSTVKSLITQHKKNLSKIIQIEKKEKNLRRVQQNSQKVEQQNLLYKARMSQIEQKVKAKDEEIKSLKQKLHQLKTMEKENICYQASGAFSVTTKESQQSNSVKLKCQSSILSYINEKQNQLNARMGKIQQIQIKIQELIEKAVLQPQQSGDSCMKCCSMIKKIKDSVMKYRKYLEQQAGQCEQMYNLLKNQIQSNLVERRFQLNQN